MLVVEIKSEAKERKPQHSLLFLLQPYLAEDKTPPRPPPPSLYNHTDQLGCFERLLLFDYDGWFSPQGLTTNTLPLCVWPGTT